MSGVGWHTHSDPGHGQGLETSCGLAAQDLEERSSSAVTKHLIAGIGALHHDCAVFGSGKRCVFVQQEIVAAVRDQEAGVGAVRRGLFGVDLNKALVAEAGHAIAQPHIKVGEILGQQLGAVKTGESVVVHQPVDIAGLADTIAVDLDAVGVESISAIVEKLVKICIVTIAIAIGQQCKKFGRACQGQEAHGRERVQAAEPPRRFHRATIAHGPAAPERVCVVETGHSGQRRQQFALRAHRDHCSDVGSGIVRQHILARRISDYALGYVVPQHHVA